MNDMYTFFTEDENFVKFILDAAKVIFQGLTFIIGLIGVILAIRQWKVTNKINRLKLVDKINQRLSTDKDLVEILRIIDYGDYWYKPSFHHSNDNELEYKMDRYLSYLTSICYMYEMKHITKKDFKLFEYEFCITLKSEQIQHYLWNLFHYSKERKTLCPYQELINYGIKKKYIDKKNFYNKDSQIFVKYLNF